jgi:hypothetical protein
MFVRPGWRLIVLAVAVSLGAASSLRLGKATGAPLPAANLAPAAATAIIAWEYDQIGPRLAYSPASQEYLAVWEDHHWAFGADSDIYARRIGANGIPIGTQFGISWDSANHRLAPAVAHNPNANEYLVVWEYAYTASDHDVYAQRVTAAGALAGGQITITALSHYESRPVVAFNATAGEYLVVWERRVGSDEFAQNDVYAQRLAANGGLLGSQFAIASGALDESAPAVAFGPAAGQYLVAWQAKQPVSGEYDVRAQRVAANGSLAGGSIGVSTWQYAQIRPQIAYNPAADAFLIVWEDHHWAFGADADIYGQRVASNGTLLGGNFGIAWDGSQRRLSPAVAYQPQANEYLVAWASEYGPTDHDIYRRRVSANGTLLEGEFGVSTRSSDERRPAVAVGAGLHGLVVWEDDRDKATLGTDIYADLARLWRLSGHVYSGASGVTTTPLAGVTVQLYCSNNAGELGGLIGSAVTGADGAYGLQVGGVCEYYSLWQIDLPGFASAGAASLGGSVIHASWIQYTYPLEGKIGSGNNFWDQPSLAPPTPTNTLPPTPTATPPISYLKICASADSYIQQESSDRNNGSADWLRVGYSAGPDMSYARALARFDLGLIPPGSTVLSAAFEAYLTSSAGATLVTLDVFRVTGAWTESGVTWNNQPAVAASAESSAAVGTVNGYKSWNVTSLAQGWVSGSLANHGLALRGPAAAYYTRAFSSREASQCPRLALVVQSAAPVNTPTLVPPPGPTPTPTQPPAPVSRSLQITGVEINQAIQDRNSQSVPLIAGKRTVVRVHLRTIDGLGSLASVRGYLYYPYPGGAVYSPINPGGSATVLANPDRGQLNDSLNFLLPAGAASGTGTMLIRVLPPEGVVFAGQGGELLNSRAVSFEAVPAMRLRVVGVQYFAGGVSYTPRNVDYARLEDWVRAAYPVGTLITSRGLISHTAGTLPNCGSVNQLLANLKTLDVLNGSATTDTRYHGLVFEGPPANYFMEGCCCASGASSGPAGAANFGWDYDGSFGDWYGGHEIGHGYGLCHPGYCAGQTADTSPHCGTYPYPSGVIGGPADDPGRFFGLDTGLMQVYGPASTDLMTYCDDIWISDFNYKRIRTKLLSAAALSIVEAAPQERLLMQGTLDPVAQTAALGPFMRIPNAVDAVERIAGDYAIVLADAHGAVLAQYPFTPRLQETETMAGAGQCSAAASQPAGAAPSLIFELVPWVDGAARVGIWHGGQELGGRNVSAHAPTVQVTAPNGGEALAGDSINVTWTAADADGDALTFSVFYSANGGVTWTTAATGLAGTSHLMHASLLAGSNTALVRVMANDGVNTGEDQSNAPFSVPGRAPLVTIAAPADQARIGRDALLALSGSAYDPETGALAGAALVWESDRDGQLGTGDLVLLAARDLSTGLHHISLRATDPAGMQASATVSVFIHQRLFLPIVIVNHAH